MALSHRAELRLRIRDDGCGFDLANLEEASREGHWGLTGIRERARKIRSRVEIWSRPGAGTEVDLRLPASVAYYDSAPSSSLRWVKRLLRLESVPAGDDGSRREDDEY
jgi:signal transduction histidine kinase